jgi:hypothetical protein
VNRILEELKLEEEESVVVIDARGDNKPAASTAWWIRDLLGRLPAMEFLSPPSARLNLII